MKKIAAVRDAVDSVWTRISAVGLLVVFLFVFAGCIRQATTSGTTTGQRETGPPASRPVKWPTDDIAVAIRTPDEARAFLARYLEECVLPLWTSPSLVDHKYGGFLNVVDAEGRPVGQKTKPLLAHLRLLFAYAVAIQRARSPAERADLRSRFDAGMRYLGTRFRDPRDGGWFFALGVDGRPVSSDKPVLGQYYAVYILAEIARMLGHSGAARLARETFDRIEPRAHDAVYGGYLNDWTLPPEAATNAVKSTGLNFHVLLALAAFALPKPNGFVNYCASRRLASCMRLPATCGSVCTGTGVRCTCRRDRGILRCTATTPNSSGTAWRRRMFLECRSMSMGNGCDRWRGPSCGTAGPLRGPCKPWGLSAGL